VRLRAAQQILDRALGKANQPIDVATVHHDIELGSAREKLAEKLEAIRGNRARGEERRGVDLSDVLRVAVKQGIITPDQLEEPEKPAPPIRHKLGLSLGDVADFAENLTRGEVD